MSPREPRAALAVLGFPVKKTLHEEREYEELREAINYAAEKGVIVAAASGNDRTSTVYYPAGYDTV